jgi:hypothetical protein
MTFHEDGTIERFCHVRFHSHDKAKTFSERPEIAALGKVTILIDDEERQYWKRKADDVRKKALKRSGNCSGKRFNRLATINPAKPEFKKPDPVASLKH